MTRPKSKNILRKKRSIRLRHKLLGTADYPRLTIFKSLKQIYIQLVDDSSGKTILSESTQSKDYKAKFKTGITNKNKEAAKNLATIFVEKAKKNKIDKIRFDRSGYKYHGTIKVLADTIRDGGVKI